MYTFIKNEIKKAEKAQENTTIPDTDITRTIKELKSIKAALYEKKDELYETEFLRRIINIKINDEVFDIFQYIIDKYSTIPLLEFELSLRYPILQRKKISDSFILYFTNKILSQEGLENRIKLDNTNLLIFKNSILKTKKQENKCIVYNRFYTDELFILLNRYNNIHDLVAPLKNSISMINYDTYNNTSHILKYFIEQRTLKHLINNGNIDAIKEYLITIDNLVYTARKLKKETSNKDWKFLSSTTIYTIINFIDHVLAIEFAYTDITYDELKQLLDDNFFNITDLPIKKEDIANSVKEHTEKLLKKEYYH